MGIEIERKFLVKNDSYKKLAKGMMIMQGFLSTVKERVVRIRVVGEKGFLTIKGLAENISRVEFEYEIPVAEAKDMLDNLCEKPIIKKLRYRIKVEEHVWEVDEFFGENDGLVIAEIELDQPDEKINLPYWVGKEVSLDPKYYNSELIKNPFSTWE